MPRGGEEQASKEVAFVLRPPADCVFAAEAVESLIGQTVKVARLDRSEAPGTIVDGRLDSDGSAILTVDVVGGIDRAPRVESDREAVDTAG